MARMMVMAAFIGLAAHSAISADPASAFSRVTLRR
jgi:hypothetical protein